MKRYLKPKWLSGILLCCIMFLGLMPMTVSAEGASTTRTDTLDLTADIFQTNQENTAEGWSWDAGTSTLTLTNANFNTGGYGIIFPIDEECTLCLVGENTLTCQKQTVTKETGRTGKLTITGDGKLTATTLADLPALDLVNLDITSGTIVTVGGINTLNDLKVSGGSLSVDTSSRSVWQDGFYACGSIEITGGTIDIKSSRVGLFVPGSGAEEPKTGLKITGGDITIQAAVAATYVGIDYEKDTYIGTTGNITINDSPIGFYECRGDITIEEKGNIVMNNVPRPAGSHADNTGGTVTIAPADYSAVDAAIAKADALNKDDYKNFSVVETAVGAVDRNKNFLEQTTVDSYVTAIENAVASLKYKDADYSRVDAAIARANSLNKNDYKDFSAVEAAVGAVVRDKIFTEQADVDAMAEAIENAIAALEKKPADTTKPSNTTPGSDKSTGADTSSNPQTGDNSHPLFFMTLMLVSCIGLLGTMVYKKRKTSK